MTDWVDQLCAELGPKQPPKGAVTIQHFMKKLNRSEQVTRRKLKPHLGKTLQKGSFGGCVYFWPITQPALRKKDK